MLKFIILFFIFVSVLLLSNQLLSLVLEKLQKIQEKKVAEAEKQLSRMLIPVPREKLVLFYTLPPLILGLAVFLLLNSLVFAIIGTVAGFLILPGFLIKNLQRQRQKRFESQLVDGLMILSSSLKGGLSLLQAMEVVSEEMPAPISQEFAMIIKENKMGISLEDSLRNMYNRINIDDLKLVINSMLVARETGGDLTKVFIRLSTTLRDNQKLIDSVKTLTTQGRLQGMIMIALPIIFVIFVYSTNPNHFDIMFQDELGRMLLVAAVVLQVVGMFLIRKFSTIKI